jgi:MFS family permease
VAALCRLILNTSRRFVYPFAPVLSRGLGVPLTAITSLIALNWAAGVMAVFIGPVTDRLGYRLMMIAGMTMMATYLGAAGLGRVAGALIGGPVWLIGGILTTSMVSALISALALGALIWGLQGWHKK